MLIFAVDVAAQLLNFALAQTTLHLVESLFRLCPEVVRSSVRTDCFIALFRFAAHCCEPQSRTWAWALLLLHITTRFTAVLAARSKADPLYRFLAPVCRLAFDASFVAFVASRLSEAAFE